MKKNANQTAPCGDDRLHSSHQIVLNLNDTAGILTYDDAVSRERAPFSGLSPNGLRALLWSNTVMAVVPDSNRIPFFIYSANNFSNRIFVLHYYFLLIILPQKGNVKTRPRDITITVTA